LNATNQVKEANNTFEYKFPFQLKINDESSRVSISDISIYNSFLFNMTALNNTIRLWRNINNINTNLDIIFPVNSYYTISEMIAYFYSKIIEAGWYLIDSYGNKVFFHRMVYNQTELKMYFFVDLIPQTLPSGWQAPAGWIGFPSFFPRSGGFRFVSTSSTTSFGSFFGLNPNQNYPWLNNSIAGSFTSTIIPKSTPINSFILTLSLINNIGLANISNICYTSPVDSNTFGELLNHTEDELVLIPIQRGIYERMEVKFLDNLYRPLNILDNNIFISFIFSLEN